MVAQILVLRELLVTFYGNEFTIGIILANWVVLEALGASFLGRRVDRLKNKLDGFVWLQMFFSIAFPIAIYLCRTLKQDLGITSGEGLGFNWVFLYSCLIVFPLSFSHGALFSFGCRVYHLFSQGQDKNFPDQRKAGGAVGRIYASEALGTILGGIALTYLFIPRLNSFQTVFIIALLNLAVCLVLVYLSRTSGRILKAVAVILPAVVLCLVFIGWPAKIHQSSINKQWSGYRLLDYQNSIYGNVAVATMDGQHSFFSNGVPIIITPSPDIAYVEEFGNIPLLFHPRPEQILIINSGAGGLINQMLKHPLRRIDYLELDPLIIEMVKRYPTALTETELADKRVDVKNVDARQFISNISDAYDVIMIGLSEPSDLQINRFFTEEFFSLTRKALKKGGIVAFTLPGSETYLRQELKDLNACVLNGLKKIYGYVRIIPGDRNLILASEWQDIIKTDPDLIVQRAEERGIKTNILSLPYLNYRFHPDRLSWFLDTLKDASSQTNRDFTPRAVFSYSAYWNAQFSPHLGKVLRVLGNINLKTISILIVILVGMVFLFYSVSPRFSKIAVSFSIFSTGFFGMLISLVLIFGFQIVYGYLYYQIGILITAFMAGIAAGSISMTAYLKRIRKGYPVFLCLEFLIICLAVAIPLLIAGFNQALFLVFCFAAGSLVGAEFPLANQIYLRSPDRLGSSAGLLYGTDLLGGWLAGMLGGIVFLPVLGLFKTCLIIVILKIGTLIMLLISGKDLKDLIVEK